ASFNEVFFDDVEVAADALLGQRGEGWRIAMATLGVERSIHGTKTQQVLRHLHDMLPLIDRLEGEEAVRARVGWLRLVARAEMIRGTWIRGLEEDPAGPIMSLVKVATSELLGEVAVLSSELLGA